MGQRPWFDYDISVTADKRRRARARGMTGKVETAECTCEWPGCDAPAQYRAPKSPDDTTSYRWFCLEHVREYNKAWDYFQNVDQDTVEAAADAARVWDRPTWRFGQNPFTQRVTNNPHSDGDAWARWGFSDPHEVLGENATLNPGRASNDPRPRRRLTREEQSAMDTLGVPHDEESRAEVKARYTDLVKLLHPDMNGGQNPEPQRLDRVLKAWKVVKKSRNFRD
ncbi:MAG: J domain-containing protein [Pseudomonadota bacterium]